VTASAADADATTNTSRIAWTTAPAGGSPFTSATGVVTVAGAIDGSAASYTITVRATSADGSFSTSDFTIAIDDLDEFDMGAVSDSAAADAVNEDALVATEVGLTAHATDGDATDDVTYSLDNSAGGLFAIHSSTGVVTVNGVLDYETHQPQHYRAGLQRRWVFLDSELYDQRERYQRGGIGPISDTDAGANAVSENAAGGVATGITAFADDPDLGDTVSYSLDDNAGGHFTIDSGTGVVTVAGSLDRETAASYNITVRATSTDTTFSTRVFTIAINDVHEFDVGAVSDANPTANAVNENAVVGTVVGFTAAASDADATTNTITYSLDNSAGGRFAIHSSTGVVTVAGALDRETAASYDITVRATSADASFPPRASPSPSTTWTNSTSAPSATPMRRPTPSMKTPSWVPLWE